MPRHAKSTKIARDEGMIDGLGKRLLDGQLMILLGVRHTQQTLAAEYNQHLQQMQEVARSEIAWRTAVERERQLEAKLKRLHRSVKSYLAGAFGPSSAMLRAFGLKPQKKAVTPVETKKLAVEKRLATRRLRKTMGKKRRKQIKGTI